MLKKQQQKDKVAPGVVDVVDKEEEEGEKGEKGILEEAGKGCSGCGGDVLVLMLFLSSVLVSN